MNMSYTLEDFNKLQEENKKLFETTQRAVAMVIELNEEANRLTVQNMFLVNQLLGLEEDIERLKRLLKGNTKDNPSGLSLAIYQGNPH